MNFHPETDLPLTPGERVLEYSPCKPRLFTGIACAVIALPTLADPILRGFATPMFVAELLLGLLFGYAALYTLVLCRQGYVCVTNRQVYCRRVHPLGGRGRLQAIPLNRIAGAKLCRVAAAWQRQYSGDLLLTLTDGSSRMLPLLQNGQFVLDTIHEACSQHAVEKREQAGPDAPSAGISR